MNRSTIVRSGASPLYANYGASSSGAKRPESRYFKPFRGIVLREAMKRYGIKFGVLIETPYKKVIQEIVEGVWGKVNRFKGSFFMSEKGWV